MGQTIERTRIEGRCPNCGKYEQTEKLQPEHWYTPCPNNECSSHDGLAEWSVRTLDMKTGVWLYLRGLRETTNWSMGPEKSSMLKRSHAVAMAKLLGGDFEAVRPYFDQVKYGWPRGSGVASKEVLDIIIPEQDEELEHGINCWERAGHHDCAVREATRVRQMLIERGVCPTCTGNPNTCSCRRAKSDC